MTVLFDPTTVQYYSWPPGLIEMTVQFGLRRSAYHKLTQISHFVNEFIVLPVLTSSADRIWQFLPRPKTHFDLPSMTVTKNNWPFLGDLLLVTNRLVSNIDLVGHGNSRATQYLSHFHISSKLDWDDNIRKIMGLNSMLRKSINQIS